MYPECLENTINYLKKLPGVGEKSAERLGLGIIELDKEEVEDLALSLKECKKKLHQCKRCGNLTDHDLCNICSDNSRDQNIICVLEDYKSVYAFEKSGQFKGIYHVLNGLISPIDNIKPEDINIFSLRDRCINPDMEVIIALKSTIEGDTTTMYIKKILENKVKNISRLSYGIPMGTEIDYLDALTLDRALGDRKKL